MARVVSAIIAIILLVLYAYCISIIVEQPSGPPSKQVGTVVNLVGALVSALVVSVLGITPPGRNPGQVLLRSTSKSAAAVTIITWVYLFVWLGCGVVLLRFWIKTPMPAEVLTAAATTWLGLAVAAAAAYLGLKPKREGTLE